MRTFPIDHKRYPFPWVPWGMRGIDNGQPDGFSHDGTMANTASCDADLDYYHSLLNDDYVTRNAPNLDETGWFAGYGWITIPPHGGSTAQPHRLGKRLPMPWRWNAKDNEWGTGRK